MTPAPQLTPRQVLAHVLADLRLLLKSCALLPEDRADLTSRLTVSLSLLDSALENKK